MRGLVRVLALALALARALAVLERCLRLRAGQHVVRFWGTDVISFALLATGRREEEASDFEQDLRGFEEWLRNVVDLMSDGSSRTLSVANVCAPLTSFTLNR